MTRARFLVHQAVASVSLNIRLLNRTRRNTSCPVVPSRAMVMNTPGSISSTQLDLEPGVPEPEPGVAGFGEGEGEGEGTGRRDSVPGVPTSGVPASGGGRGGPPARGGADRGWG